MSLLRSYLEANAILGASDLDAATRHSQAQGGSLDTALLELGLLTAADLLTHLADACGLPVVPARLLETGPVRPSGHVPKAMLDIGWVLPLALENGEVLCAVHPDLPDARLGQLYRQIRGFTPMVAPECCLAKLNAERTGSIVAPRFAMLVLDVLDALQARAPSATTLVGVPVGAAAPTPEPAAPNAPVAPAPAAFTIPYAAAGPLAVPHPDGPAGPPPPARPAPQQPAPSAADSIAETVVEPVLDDSLFDAAGESLTAGVTQSQPIVDPSDGGTFPLSRSDSAPYLAASSGTFTRAHERQDARAGTIPADRPTPQDSRAGTAQPVSQDSRSAAAHPAAQTRASQPQDHRAAAQPVPQDSRPAQPDRAAAQPVPQDSRPAQPDRTAAQPVPQDSRPAQPVPQDSRSGAPSDRAAAQPVPQDSRSGAPSDRAAAQPVPQDSRGAAAQPVPQDSRSAAAVPVPQDSRPASAPSAAAGASQPGASDPRGAGAPDRRAQPDRRPPSGTIAAPDPQDMRPIDVAPTPRNHTRSGGVTTARSAPLPQLPLAQRLAPARAALAQARERDRITESLVRAAIQVAPRVALFGVKREGLRALAAPGSSLHLPRSLVIPIPDGSLLDRAVSGEIRLRLLTEPQLAFAVGRPLGIPCILEPVYAQNRCVLMLYIDRSGGPFELSEQNAVRDLCDVARGSLEALLRIMGLGARGDAGAAARGDGSSDPAIDSSVQIAAPDPGAYVAAPDPATDVYTATPEPAPSPDVYAAPAEPAPSPDVHAAPAEPAPAPDAWLTRDEPADKPAEPGPAKPEAPTRSDQDGVPELTRRPRRAVIALVNPIRRDPAKEPARGWTAARDQYAEHGADAPADADAPASDPHAPTRRPPVASDSHVAAPVPADSPAAAAAPVPADSPATSAPHPAAPVPADSPATSAPHPAAAHASAADTTVTAAPVPADSSTPSAPADAASPDPAATSVTAAPVPADSSDTSAAALPADSADADAGAPADAPVPADSTVTAAPAESAADPTTAPADTAETAADPASAAPAPTPAANATPATDATASIDAPPASRVPTAPTSAAPVPADSPAPAAPVPTDSSDDPAAEAEPDPDPSASTSGLHMPNLVAPGVKRTAGKRGDRTRPVEPSIVIPYDLRRPEARTAAPKTGKPTRPGVQIPASLLAPAPLPGSARKGKATQHPTPPRADDVTLNMPMLVRTPTSLPPEPVPVEQTPPDPSTMPELTTATLLEIAPLTDTPPAEPAPADAPAPSEPPAADLSPKPADPAPALDLPATAEDLDAALAAYLQDPDDPATQAALRALGAALYPRIAARFPGPIDPHSASDVRSFPPPSAHGPLLRACVEIGEPITPHVLELLDHQRPQIRFYAAFLFQELRDPRALRPLAHHAFDPDPDVRLIATRVLESYNRTPGFVAATEHVRAALGGRDRDRALLATEAAGTLRDTRAVPILIDLLSVRDKQIRETALEALCSITAKHHGYRPAKWKSWFADHGEQPRVQWVMDALRHRDPAVRRWAADELTRVTGHRIPPPPAGEKITPRYVLEAWEAWWDHQGAALFG